MAGWKVEQQVKAAERAMRQRWYSSPFSLSEFLERTAEFRPREHHFRLGDSSSSRVCAKSKAEQQFRAESRFHGTRTWAISTRPVVATEAGVWEIHYKVYLTDPTSGKAKRHHCSRVVSYRPKMLRPDAEKILAAELAAERGEEK